MSHGFIGLGDMGGPIATYISGGGISSFAHDPADTSWRTGNPQRQHGNPYIPRSRADTEHQLQAAAAKL